MLCFELLYVYLSCYTYTLSCIDQKKGEERKNENTISIFRLQQ